MIDIMAVNDGKYVSIGDIEVNDTEKKIDHEFMDNLVCPYCGYEDEDAGDYLETDHGEWSCDECGKVFSFQADYSITWCTSKIIPVEEIKSD